MRAVKLMYIVGGSRCCWFFFFKQKTAYEMRISDWSSDVCSSDLVVLVDGCDRSGTAPAFCARAFYEMLRARLRPHGLLVLNVIGEKHRIDAVVGAAAEAFGGRLIVMNEIGRASCRERV